MEPLTWTGSLAGLNIIFLGLAVLLALAVAVQIVVSFFPASEGGTVSTARTSPLCAHGHLLGALL